MEQSIKKDNATLTDYARLHMKWLFEPIARGLNKLGIPPNTVTIIGLIGHVISAYFLARGELLVGGLIMLALAPVDALDGTMARLLGEASSWGAFVDSVVDRYSEIIVFGGLLYFYLQQGDMLASGLIYVTVFGSVLVSYIRARAQSLGFDTKIGLFSRLERYLILIPALVLNIPLIGLGILALGTHITALQRIFVFRRQARK